VALCHEFFDYGAALKRSNRWANADRDPDDPSAGRADRVRQRREFALKALKLHLLSRRDSVFFRLLF